MKTDPAKFLSVLSSATLTLCFFHAVTAKALPVNLGAAGNYAVLEIGSGNVSLAAAPPTGSINGNVGAAGGNVSDGGNLGIGGSVYLASGATSSGLSGNVSGGINNGYNMSSAISAALNASSQAAGLATSGGGLGFTTINEGNNVTLNLTPGVYNLTDFKLQNGDIIRLTAGGSYVFNISGTLSLNSAEVLAAAGLSVDNILFNVTDSQGVGFSGGLNNECVLDGILLAPEAAVGLTPGYVDGEIISGGNINIASGGTVQGGQSVPDAGSTVLLLGVACGFLVLLNLTVKRFQTCSVKQ